MIPSHVHEDPLAFLRPSENTERFLAHLIDLIVITMIQVPLIILLFVQQSLMNIVIASSIATLTFILYFTLLEGIFSTTIGKRALDLKVISLNGMCSPSLRESFLRNTFRLADILVLYLPLFLMKGGRRIGDLLANTAVVSKKFVRIELPPPGSGLRKEIGESIVKALSLRLESLDIKPQGVPRAEIREYVARILREGEELVDRVAYFISNPSLQLMTLGAEGIAEIYERASELCSGECSEILRNRARIIRALYKKAERRDKIGFSWGRGFKRLSPYFLLSIALFLISSILAYYLKPDWMESLIKEIFGKDVIPSEESPLTLSTVIFLNNLRVVLATLGLAPLIFMPFVTLTVNGFLVGFVLSISSDPAKALLLILPHGVPELSSIFLSTAVGIRVSRYMLDSKKWPRAREAAMESVDLMILSFIVLLYAAFIEGFVTRWISNYPALDIAFSIAEAVIIYLILRSSPSSSRDLTS